jgi:anti-anti-sigma factor
MSFERTDHEKYSTVRLTEPRLDLKAMKSLNEHFVECKKQYINRIILDLSECETISSEGIGLLVSIWEFFQHDGKMFIVIKQESVISLLKECGLYTALQECFVDTLETATG